MEPAHDGAGLEPHLAPALGEIERSANLEDARFEDGVLTAELPPASWTMLRLAVE